MVARVGISNALLHRVGVATGVASHRAHGVVGNGIVGNGIER